MMEEAELLWEGEGMCERESAVKRGALDQRPGKEGVTGYEQCDWRASQEKKKKGFVWAPEERDSDMKILGRGASPLRLKTGP